MRLYEMFIGDFEKAVPWSQNGVRGCRRFLERVWKLNTLLDSSNTETGYSHKLESKIHKTIKKVSQDFESMKYNTAIAAMMALINDFYDEGKINKEDLKTLLILLNPAAPHITEEMWEELNFGGMLNEQKWPEWDEAKTVDDQVEIAVQINGKVKGKVLIPVNAEQDQVKELIKADEKINAALEGKNIIKEVYVKGKIYNIVAK